MSISASDADGDIEHMAKFFEDPAMVCIGAF